MQSLIVLSLTSYALETLPYLNNDQIHTLRIIELACISIFTVEYVLRIWVAEKPTKYIFSFYGLIDLAAIAPFYISTGLDLRS
ncbi:MAG: voltage-gated potassium channel, partial [Halieaceae bacterium]